MSAIDNSFRWWIPRPDGSFQGVSNASLPIAKAVIALTAALAFLTASALAKDAEAPKINPETGFIEVMLPSEFQAGPTLVEILVPDRMDAGVEYPVLYILPVGKPGPEFGSGLEEAKKADIANKLGIICVAPQFTLVPWYGNHATDPEIRQEEHILKRLIPFIDTHYPTRKNPEGRWLIGFSKSGWGAFTLLLRNPDVFGYAAAWDAPLMLTGDDGGKKWGPMGIEKVFGTKEAFQQFLPTRLAGQNASRLKQRPRLVLGVGSTWSGQATKFHALLDQLGIPHVYLPDLFVPHRWDSGWFPPMVDALANTARATGLTGKPGPPTPPQPSNGQSAK